MRKTLAALTLLASLAMPSMAMAADEETKPLWHQVSESMQRIILGLPQIVEVDAHTAGQARKVEDAAKAAAKSLDIQPATSDFPE